MEKIRIKKQDYAIFFGIILLFNYIELEWKP